VGVERAETLRTFLLVKSNGYDNQLRRVGRIEHRKLGFYSFDTRYIPFFHGSLAECK